MQIPWWAKLGPKLVLARLPFGYSIWQRLGIFRHGSMDKSDYAIQVFDAHVKTTGLTGRLQGKTILELGPGDSISTALLAATHGARAILVDSGAFARVDVAPYLELAEELSARGLPGPDVSGCASVEEILVRCHARYLSDGLASLSAVPDGSVDLIFSQAVLEHVRRREFLDTMRHCRRILVPAGVCSHQVDLKDHLSGGLNNLRFSGAVWESEIFATSGFYTNRIQWSQMCRLFAEAGFEVELRDVRRWETLPTPRRKLAKEFRSIAEDDLCVSGFHVLLR